MDSPIPREPLTELDGAELRRMFGAGTLWLERNAPLVNSLNIFPVPDGDTGTNMLLTMQAAMHEANARPSSNAGAVMLALAQGSLLGARGNSGVSLSQIFRGMARCVSTLETIDAQLFAEALAEGSQAAYAGFVKPVEGTLLTVIRQAADEAVTAAGHSDDIRLVMARAHAAAREAVVETPLLLPVLQEAGVVDAGGQGVAFLIEGALKYLEGEPLDSSILTPPAQNLTQLAVEDGYGYDIQFHIRGSSLNVAEIRETISALGDSALIVGDETLVKVHIHAANPGAIIQYGAEQGPLVNIIIENMQAQYLDFIAGNTADVRVGAENLGAILPHQQQPPTVTAGDTLNITTVAVAAGEGFSSLFQSIQPCVIVPGGPTMNPSAGDILHAINQVNAQEVIVLPNDKNIVPAAEQVQELTSKVIQVIPSTSVPQGLAAMLAFNPQADLESNFRNMSAAILHVRTLDLTFAVRSALVNNIAVQEGRPIALVDGELVGSGDDLMSLMVETMHLAGAAEAEVVTIYYGSEVSVAAAQESHARIQHAFPAQETQLHYGGQPLYPYIISIE